GGSTSVVHVLPPSVDFWRLPVMRSYTTPLPRAASHGRSPESVTASACGHVRPSSCEENTDTFARSISVPYRLPAPSTAKSGTENPVERAECMFVCGAISTCFQVLPSFSERHTRVWLR